VAWILRGLSAAIVAICACGLITRLLPHLWPTTADIAVNRLSFPVTYWNALGLLAAVGVVACLHLSSELREPPFVRVAAAAAIPVLLGTLYFTFSRGAIVVGVVAVVVYAVVGRPRGLASSLLAVLPGAVTALVFAYDADALASADPTSAAAVSQGHWVAVAVGLSVAVTAALRWALLRVDARLLRFRWDPAVRRRLARGGAALALTVVAGLAVGFQGSIAHQYDRFVRRASPGRAGDLRARLTDPGNNGRLDMWNVALRVFRARPVAGAGAGTFAGTWARQRPTADTAQDAHSLYLEVLDELGVVGVVLLLVAVVSVVARAAWLARGADRALFAAVFAVLLAVALHAGVDWDWEMPVVVLPFFVLGGVVLARSEGAPILGDKTYIDGQIAQGTRPPRPQVRLLMALGCLGLAVAPAYVWLSQRQLDRASAAFAAGRCRPARSDALDSISILGVRPEPYEIVAYCDMRADMPQAALASVRRAISLDPGNWNYRYDLAVIRAAAGLDPRAAAYRAYVDDPLEPLTAQTWRSLSRGGPAHWQAEGRMLVDEDAQL
jgi:hypothetical protein